MDLQTIFYIVAIIAMVLWIFIIAFGVVFFFLMRRYTNNLKSDLRDKVTSLAFVKNKQILKIIGFSLGSFIAHKFSKRK